MNDTQRTPPLLAKPTRRQLAHIAKWLVCYIICSLLPIWGSLVLLQLFTNPTWAFQDFTSNGEFALFSASLLGSLFFLLFRDSLAPRFPHSAFFGIAGLVGIVLATLFFAGAVLSAKAAAGSQADASVFELNPSVLGTLSVILYGLALIVFLLATYVDIRLTSYQPADTRVEDMKELIGDFHKLREGGQ